MKPEPSKPLSPRRRDTIRFRLGLAVAIALSPILVLGVVQAVLGYTHDADARRLSLVSGALRSAAAAGAKMQAAAGVLETLTPETVGAACAPRLASLLEHLPDYQNFMRLDASGRVVCAAAPTSAGENVRGAHWFDRLRAGDPVVVAAAPRTLGSDRPAVLAAMRSGGPGRHFDGALVALISTESLRPASDPSLPADTEVAILDDQGRVAASTAQGFPAPPPDWQERSRGPRGFLFTAKTPRGERVQVIAPLVGHDLYVMLSSPAPLFLSWARINAIYNIVLPLLGWLGAWAAVWVVTDRVVIRWLSYLDRIAAIYAKGRFSVRPVKAETAPEEIRALAQTLDAMAEAIVARDLSLRESLSQKDTLMREIHHRVKNNLQIITSLLNMQQRALKDPTAREAMSDTRQRITALALIYRALYQSPDLRRVDVRQFLEELVGQLASGDTVRPTGVRTELDADDVEIDPDKLAPLALFAVEAIAEARKHDFSSGDGIIRVEFRAAADSLSLEISNDGDPASLPAADTVGRTLMSAFARQLRGRMERVEDGRRHIVRLIFPPPADATIYPPPPFQLSAAGNSR